MERLNPAEMSVVVVGDKAQLLEPLRKVAARVVEAAPELLK
jgi:hypothetical protein